MAYLDMSLDECAAYGWQGGPEFNTQIVQMANGRENRNALWANARHKYQVPFNNIDRTTYSQIKQKHLIARGRLHNFQFTDRLDYQAVNEEFADGGDGVTTVFQLGKISSSDGVFYYREVYIIDDGATVTVNNVPSSPTIDQERGLVTFAVAPANGTILRWTGTFKVWVRFDQDYLPFSIDNGGGDGAKYMNGSIDLIEQPPPPL